MINNSNESLFEILSKHIVNLCDENDVEVSFTSVYIKFEKRKLSATFSPVLYVNNKALSAKQLKMYKVTYKCRCGRYIKILLHKYLHKTRFNCIHCLQDRSFADSVHTKPYELKKGIRTKANEITYNFDSMSDEFKNHYKEIHLSEDEFYYYLPYMYSINDYIITNETIKNIKYYYALPSGNQFLFTPKISINDNDYMGIKSIKLKCLSCGKIYNIHTINIRQINVNNIKCKECTFYNHTYIPTKYKTLNIYYQSMLEYIFIEKCISNNIEIENGPNILYYFNDKTRTYISDFYLPKYKYIIEIKGSNHFYRNDIKTGKLQAKIDAAEQYAKNNNMKYKLLLDNNEQDTFITSILMKDIV